MRTIEGQRENQLEDEGATMFIGILSGCIQPQPPASIMMNSSDCRKVLDPDPSLWRVQFKGAILGSCNVGVRFKGTSWDGSLWRVLL